MKLKEKFLTPQQIETYLKASLSNLSGPEDDELLVESYIDGLMSVIEWRDENILALNTALIQLTRELRSHEKHICELQRENTTLQSKLIYGFYEEQYPSYIQGSKKINELCSLVTEKELNGLVMRLKALEIRIKELTEIKEK